jgi:hypothetical protein
MDLTDTGEPSGRELLCQVTETDIVLIADTDDDDDEA